MTEQNRTDSLLWIESPSAEEKIWIDSLILEAKRNAPIVKNIDRSEIKEKGTKNKPLLQLHDDTLINFTPNPTLPNEIYLQETELHLYPYLLTQAINPEGKSDHIVADRIQHELRHAEEAKKAGLTYYPGLSFKRNTCGELFAIPSVHIEGICTRKQFKTILEAPADLGPADKALLE